LTQYFAVLGSVEDRIVDCFQRGGGVPYSAFHRFHEVMAEDSGISVIPALQSHILPLVAGLTQELEQGIDVLDVGCGSGRAVIQLGKSFPNSRFRGFDISSEAVARGRREAAQAEVGNVELSEQDAASFTDARRYDLITTFDAIHDQAKPRKVLANIARALRPGGVYLMQDIGASSHHHENHDHPLGPLLYTISCMHCMTVSLAADGEGLGAMWGEQQARALLAEAGFQSVEVHRLDHDVQNYYYVCRLG
jgi:SAM-dependent methyltransferase